LNYAINKIFSLNLKTIKDAHRELYRELREWFELPPRIALDCYRDAIANARSWRNNPEKGRAPGLRGSACYYTPDLDIGSGMTM